jgi:hypothetical protein
LELLDLVMHGNVHHRSRNSNGKESLETGGKATHQ